MKLAKSNPYAIKRAEFLGCKIDLSSRPLIPRPETEYWTERFIDSISNHSFKILDAFAGSGCIGIAVMSKMPKAQVDFAEIDPAHVLQIKSNIKLNGLTGRRHKIYKTNILKNTSAYDFILANPPYLKKEDLVRGITEFEPKRALVGGKDGLSHIRRLLGQARGHLSPGGSLWMEFHSKQKNKINELARHFGYTHTSFKKDQYGKWRYVILSFF